MIASFVVAVHGFPFCKKSTIGAFDQVAVIRGTRFERWLTLRMWIEDRMYSKYPQETNTTGTQI